MWRNTLLNQNRFQVNGGFKTHENNAACTQRSEVMCSKHTDTKGRKKGRSFPARNIKKRRNIKIMKNTV